MSEDDVCVSWGDRHSFERHVPDMDSQLFERDMLANSDSDKRLIMTSQNGSKEKEAKHVRLLL
jgi:hypothetical protein